MHAAWILSWAEVLPAIRCLNSASIHFVLLQPRSYQQSTPESLDTTRVNARQTDPLVKSYKLHEWSLHYSVSFQSIQNKLGLAGSPALIF